MPVADGKTQRSSCLPVTTYLADYMRQDVSNYTQIPAVRLVY